MKVFCLGVDKNLTWLSTSNGPHLQENLEKFLDLKTIKELNGSSEGSFLCSH